MRGVDQGVFCRAAGVSSVVSDATKILSKRDAAKAWFTRSRAALLFISVATAAPSSEAAQQLVLTANVGKTTFFEGEPIYFLVQLKNIGTDTAWVYFFNLFSPAVTLSASRGLQNPTAVAKPISDYLLSPSWRGEPIAPGAAVLNTIVLQNIFGDQTNSRRHLFNHHLPPDEYEIRLEFDAHLGIPGATPLSVKAAPISFHVRVPTALEEKEVRDLEAIREMGWDTMRVAGLPRAARYKTTLINWVNRRFMDEPDDPFLPFLLYEGIYGVGQILWKSIQAGEVQRFDADTSEVVSRLRLAVIDRHRASIGGAHLVQALTARHHDQIASLASRLSHTPAGDMARYQVEREQHEQHAKQQPPR